MYAHLFKTLTSIGTPSTSKDTPENFDDVNIKNNKRKRSLDDDNFKEIKHFKVDDDSKREEILKYFLSYGTLTEDLLYDAFLYSFHEPKFYNNVKDYSIFKKYETILIDDRFKVYMLYTLLNVEQKKILLSWLDDTLALITTGKKFVNVLDASAGTGKSFLVKVYINIVCRSVHKKFIVYSHNLLKEFNFPALKTKTTAGFFMKLFGHRRFITYEYSTEIENQLATLFLWCLRLFHKPPELEVNILIVDEYTVINPALLCFLISFIINTNELASVIFTGHRSQQHAINPCYHFNISNFYIFDNFAKSVQVNHSTLTIHMRAKSLEFNDKLDRLLSLVTKMDDPCPLDKKKIIYQLFKDYFYKPELLDETVCFLSSYHKQLNAKMTKIKKVVNFKKASYYVEDDSDIQYEIPEANANAKFQTVLLLKEKFMYLLFEYIDFKRIQQPVMLESITQKKNENDELVVTELVCRKLNGSCITLSKLEDLTKLLPAAYIQYIKKYGEKCYEVPIKRVYNFPLMSLSVRTFHSVQGLTLPTNLTLEINLDNITLNAVYVAFSRLQEEKCLGKIHTSDLNILKNSDKSIIDTATNTVKVENTTLLTMMTFFNDNYQEISDLCLKFSEEADVLEIIKENYKNFFASYSPLPKMFLEFSKIYIKSPIKFEDDEKIKSFINIHERVLSKIKP